ncbi:hypothetical protein BH10BDE1_BH10BDE1_09940 [soil metagenome]
MHGTIWVMLSLVLHANEIRKPRHAVRASARRILGSSLMTVRFEIDGSRNVAWPADSAVAGGERRDELWKQTCLECFVRGSENIHGKSYREWNFSPSGDWAAYSFESYRAGMSKPNVVAPSIERIELIEKMRFEIDLELDEVSAIGAPLLALSAVVVEKDEAAPFYWALTHVGAKPDFHLRESFTLELES